MSREESKVVVTTIQDLEFTEDHSADGAALSPSDRGGEESKREFLAQPGSSDSAWATDQEPFLMFPPRTQQHVRNCYTLRKPQTSSFFKHPTELEKSIPQDHPRQNFPESAQEFVEQYREKQKAGFMYGTLRPNVNPGYPDCGGVVPPPPMFEEGNVNLKTPLLLPKKTGKSEKKDKMESRV